MSGNALSQHHPAPDNGDFDAFSLPWSSALASFSPIPSFNSLSYSFPAAFSTSYLDPPTASPIPLVSPPLTSQPTLTPQQWADTLFSPLPPPTLPPPPPPTPATTIHPPLTQPGPVKVEAVASGAVRESRRVVKRRKRGNDLQRRRRESAALARLAQLLEDEDENGGGSVVEEAASDESDKPKRVRVDVLEQSAQRIEQLQMLLAQVVDVNKRQVRHSTHSTTATCPTFYQTTITARVPPLVSWMLGAQMTREGLDWSTRMASSVCTMLLHMPTGLVADVTDQYLCHTMIVRSHLVGRRYLPPARMMQCEPLGLADSSHLVRVSDRPLHRGKEGTVHEIKQQTQYERSLRLLGQLLAGEVDVIDAVWRVGQGDGKVYEKRLIT